MVNITYSLIGANEDEIVFDNSTFVLNTGFTGFGIPATQVRIAESAGDGGTWRHTKRGVRDIDLPITILGDDRADVQTKMRRLARLTQDALGATILKAAYSDGTSLTIGLHYVGGAEGQWGEDEGMTWNKWVMSFQAPVPFWVSEQAQDFVIRSGGSGRGLLPQLTKLKVASTQALGEISVTNDGDVASYPLWRIDGPINNFTATDGTLTFTFASLVEEGETIFVDTETNRVYDQTGANRYSILGSAPKLFPFQPGSSTITVGGDDTTASTIIHCSYASRFEVVH